MLMDDIKKANILGISYGEYKALEKDFYSTDQKKSLRATLKMAELMEKASEKLKEKAHNDFNSNNSEGAE